ncbi:MAG: flagellar hook protein FlgE [Hyphomicrobiales bacterium]|nr:flagellar hook protein FlgE [Hyphomicrobiales bacterium]
MGLYGMMRTAVSGMNAQATRLSAVADNVANAGTNGYKRTGIDFSTQVLAQNAGSYNSGSVTTSIQAEIGRQGAIKSTSSPTDLAISGQGFFIVEDGAGVISLTRAGSFIVDNEGVLTNANGNSLLGYDISNTGAPPVANGFGGLVPVNVGIQALDANPTTEGVLVPNLPATASIVAPGSLPSDNLAISDYAGKSSMVVYDSLGNEQIVDIYYAKTAVNTWEMTAYDAADSTNGSFPYASAALSTQTLVFDGTTGQILGGGSVSAIIPIPGGVTMDLQMDGISQFATDYQLISAKANGSAPASIDRVEVASDGTVFGIFQNGFAAAIYQLALAKVISPNKLAPLPGNLFAATIESGDVLVGAADTQGFGSIAANALEESNVDMAAELTIMIESQRSYTANSKVFQTGSDLMDVLVNLKR